ncbi:hypothetical protein [Ornithinimicrobium kibberense]|uniref:hypothetical protein n=1 Tax=Ornithinimicrobium kibberense TaxID=282060 RepID=UPI00361F2D69
MVHEGAVDVQADEQPLVTDGVPGLGRAAGVLGAAHPRTLAALRPPAHSERRMPLRQLRLPEVCSRARW